MTDIRELKAEKMRLEIEEARQQLQYSALALEEKELELKVAREKEADRLARPANTGSINFFGPVSASNVDQVIDALQHWETRDAEGPKRDITITFNSEGGSVSDGLALYDTIQRLRRKGHHVTTRGIGTVASMAAVLLQAGDERILDQRAKMLIHEGSQMFRQNTTLTRGEREDLEKYADMLLEDILDILAERSACSRDDIERHWRRTDWWLRAPEAVKLGFADRVE